MENKLGKRYSEVLLGYQIATLIMLFMKANPYVNSMTITTIFMGIIVVFGGLFSLYIFWKMKFSLLCNKYFIVLGIFVFSYMITILLNRSSSLGSNIKDAAWFVILIMTFFFGSFFLNRQKLQHNYRILMNVYVLITFVFAFFSLFFVFANVGGVEDYGNWGFLSQRLFGLYRSPNYGAIYCVISVFVSLELIQRIKKCKVFYVLNIVSNMLYIIYSGSKSGIVVLVAGLVVWFFFELLSVKSSGPLLKKRLLYLLVTVCLLGVSFTVVKDTTAVIVGKIHSESAAEVAEAETKAQTESKKEAKADNKKETQKTDKPKETEKETKAAVSFERTDYVPGQEFGNGRIGHWQQALSIFPHYAVFGTSMRGYTNAVLTVMPELAEDFRDYSIENDFVSLLVCTGAVGFTLFMIFAIMVLVRLVGYIYSTVKTGREESLKRIQTAVALFVLIVISALFTDAIVFTNVVQSAVFWLALGYFLCQVELEKKANERLD